MVDEFTSGIFIFRKKLSAVANTKRNNNFRDKDKNTVYYLDKCFKNIYVHKKNENIFVNGVKRQRIKIGKRNEQLSSREQWNISAHLNTFYIYKNSYLTCPSVVHYPSYTIYSYLQIQ